MINRLPTHNFWVQNPFHILENVFDYHNYDRVKQIVNGKQKPKTSIEELIGKINNLYSLYLFNAPHQSVDIILSGIESILGFYTLTQVSIISIVNAVKHNDLKALFPFIPDLYHDGLLNDKLIIAVSLTFVMHNLFYYFESFPTNFLDDIEYFILLDDYEGFIFYIRQRFNKYDIDNEMIVKELKTILDNNHKLLRSYRVKRIFIYGSLLDESITPYSDIDLAFEFDPGYSYFYHYSETFKQISLIVEVLTNRKVDIVLYDDILASKRVNRYKEIWRYKAD